MLILEAMNIKKYFSDRLILEFESLKIYSGDKIGIVGLNGSGKTTLLNLLSKELEPDEGTVNHYCGISYIHQFSNEGADASQKTLKEFNVSDKTSQAILSGGEKTRIKIANALSQNNVLLFADEPTSNLDYKGTELLSQNLSAFDALLIISHDRYLLDKHCNKILEVKDGKVKLYNGNYSAFKSINKLEYESMLNDYEKYISEKNRLEAAILERKGKSKTIRKAPKRMGNSEARLHKRASNEKQEKIDNSAKSLETRLTKLDKKEKPEEIPKIKLDFSLTNPPENKLIVTAKNLSFSYGSRQIFVNSNFEIPKGRKAALISENGMGKTTLLNLIYNGYEGIYTVPKARFGFFHQGFENLDMDKTILENVMADSIQNESVTRTILARLLFSGNDVYKKIGVLSGGEKIKVSFAKLFVSSANVLLLDEPTNYLDIHSIEALQDILKEYEGTVIFVSHDSEFTNAVADKKLYIRDKMITESIESQEPKDKNCEKNSGKSEEEKMLLQMRLTMVLSKMSSPTENKEALEIEYQNILERLRLLT